tara:strand:+ start:248 stop:514 length:267 start_codon:yes stop_codon:yes gene_type:complete
VEQTNNIIMDKKLKILIERAKEDIKEFLEDNPGLSINKVEDLHTYYDANCYVETLFTKNGEFKYDEESEQEANLVFKELDNFIKNQAI